MHNSPPGAAPCSMRYPAQCSTLSGAANRRKEGQPESQDSLVAPLEVAVLLKAVVPLEVVVLLEAFAP